VIRASTRDLSRSCVQVEVPPRRDTPAAAASCPATEPTRRPPRVDARVQGPGRRAHPSAKAEPCVVARVWNRGVERLGRTPAAHRVVAAPPGISSSI
jgi:hypothetical protein